MCVTYFNYRKYFIRKLLLAHNLLGGTLITGVQVRSGQSAHSEQYVVLHACHGNRCLPTPAPLSGTGKEKGRGTACIGGNKGVQAV